ncbi:MAG: ubiquinol-cytochrome c reductase iron-sulfur subunit [Bacteroidetes bacterium]|nr:ubiquinol-cytochrome c reductase iron-sulfur subunit [Bacteroidota bacterium]
MAKIDEKSGESQIKPRRDFVNILLGGSVAAFIGAIGYPIYSYLEPPKVEEVKVSNVKLGKVNDMEKDSGKIVKFGNKPVIVIRTINGEYKAFTATCTHLDCIVQYKKEYGQIYCACHNGRYDLNGKNVSGPPPAPLERYNVSIKGDEVIIFKEVS